jgi:hypothetical protein
MYVHYTDVACALLTLVFLSTVRVQATGFVGPWTFPFSPPPHFHGRFHKIFSIPRGKFIIQGVAQWPTAYKT